MNERPFVSIIIPCRNEESFIGPCLDSVLANGYPLDRLEVLVVDGMSEDGTRVIVEDYAARHDCVRLLDNPRRITPAGLNIGIAHATGRIVMRMDAHSQYPRNYVLGLVAWQEKTGADNVGGVCTTLPGNDTYMAQAIAIGLSHPFGVGNAHFRIGVREPRWVDTVPFGCYRREVFDRIGVFDEDLIRNQDDEFNLRLIRQGGKILLVPDIASSYYARDSLIKLAQMYYQYGYFKPLVLRKVRAILTVRQVIPPVFILTLIGSGTMALFFPAMRMLAASIMLLYLIGVVGCSTMVAFKRGLRYAPGVCVVFPVLHVSYGVGFLRGIMEFLMRGQKRTMGTEIPISR
jgi:glycosyltransferase involved in cell wall biosynthesis